ncbi:MAG: M13 family metallopeptidase, partial [Oscillospiraceae bacterium]|nr:M13 family metallopeptidase [Oscillospiraceae bacterium]
TAASRYRTDGQPYNVSATFPAEVQESSRYATRIEVLADIDATFGKLPEPTGDYLRTAPNAPVYTDVPDWAADAIANLANARVILPTEDGLLHGGDDMSAAELDLILRRIFTLYGTRPQDDFYAAINKAWLNEAAIPEGSEMNSAFDTLRTKMEAVTEDIFNSIMADSWEKGTIERKITDMYNVGIDMEARNALGVAPIKPYLDRLLAASSMKELEDALAFVSQEAALNPLFTIELLPDAFDKTKYSLYMTVPSFYMLDSGEENEDMIQMGQEIETLFKLAGYENARDYADAVLLSYRTMSAITEEMMKNVPEEKDDGSGGIMMFFDKPQPLTRQEIDEKFPDINLDAMLAAVGLTSEPTWYSAAVGNSLDVWAGFYKPEHLEELKVYAAYKLLSDCAGMLSADFIAASGFYDVDSVGFVTRESVKQKARTYIDKLYVERNFSADSKADVVNMTERFIGIYRDRIANLTWMSEATKTMAQRKLDTMVIKAGYPDNWYDELTIANILSAEDGGTAFGNDAAYRKARLEMIAGKQGKPVDRHEWTDAVTEANAFYRPDNNEIIFPAAILQPPFYTPGAKAEQNMAGIGWVIGHEITHAFDNSGAKFDEYGNEKNWWTDEDFAKFDELCKAVVTYYDGYEVAPGMTMYGAGTLGENIADLGGVSCAMQAVSQLPNPDYELFFTSAAQLWKSTATREILEMIVERDPHSPSKARANKPIQTLREFYDTFNVQPGDGMYIAPEKRVKIW